MLKTICPSKDNNTNKDKPKILAYKDIYDIDNLYQGYLKARKGKRNKKAVLDFEKDLTFNLTTLSEELKNKTYKVSKYRSFKIYEPKERVVTAPSFRDSVVQHTIYALVYDSFDRTFIYDSYGCRKDKGTHKASDKLQRVMRKSDPESYYLQLDIEKYYYSVNHSILRNSLSKVIKDTDIVNLMMMFVNIISKVGLYIGNLLSQLYGLIYLNWLDHFIKRVLKIKYYIRYVDDFVLVNLTHQQCTELLKKIKSFLKDNLKLSLSKSKIQKIKKGINFIGYRTWRSKKFIRKRSLYHFSKAVRKRDILAIHSLLGHSKDTSSYKHLLKLLKEHNLGNILPQNDKNSETTQNNKQNNKPNSK